MNSATMTPESRREGLKLFFDVFKNLTTISSGSILLLATFTEKFKQPYWRLMIPLAFLGFMIATVASIIVMLSTARTIRRNELTDQLPDRTGNVAYMVAVIGFAVAVGLVCAFAVKNF